MAKRNIWTDDEIKCFLDIMKEKKILNLLDGKKYKNKNVYKMVESEMRTFGFETKSTEQIILKWRKLKAEYFKTKSNNKISGRDRAHCPFEEELSEILESRPGASFEGVDTSGSGCSSALRIALDEINSEAVSSESSCEQTTESPKETNQSIATNKRKRRSTPFEKLMSRCTTNFLAGQEKLQNDFFKKQKELIQFEHQLQQEHEKEMQKNIMDETTKLLQDSRNFFLSHIATNNNNEVIIYDPSSN